MPKAILAEQGGKGGSSIGLLSIEVTTAPTKTSYLAGDTFNSSGMVVTATYGTDSIALTTAEVTGYSVSPTTLTDGVTSVTITYTEGGVTCTCTQAVTVTHKLSSISVTTAPTTTSYEYGSTLSTSGMVVTATYSDNKTASVTGYSCSPTSLTTVGTQTVTVSYTENGITKTTTFTVTVTRKKVSKPTWKSNLTYNGSSQSVTSTSYWNNYNTTYMSMSGTTSATNAGSYSATFTPNSNYQWSDGTTTATSVTWTINKKTPSAITLSSTSVSLDATNYSSGVAVTVTRDGDGTISVSSSNSTACKVSLSGTTITIKGDGSTAGTYTVTVSVAAGTNYTAPSSKTISVTTSYWEWGSETATADATWWAGLKTWLSSSTTTERSECVGKTKSVTLTSTVQGTTTHLVRCIGYDCDGSKTLTFQTKNCLATTTVFGSSDGYWIGSTVRTICQNYYSYFPGKASIKTVSKGTCASTNSSQSGTPTYNNETVFLPSDCEMGFIAGCSSSNGKGYAASYDEYCSTNTSETSYQYYTSNSSRIKYLGDSGASATYYWERSLYYNDSSFACIVGSDGTPYGGGYRYSGSRGAAPAFAIG